MLIILNCNFLYSVSIANPLFSKVKTAGLATLPGGTSGPDYSSPDHGFEEYKIKREAGDPTRREFTYFMLGGGRMLYASVARLTVIRFVASMNPAADVLGK